MAHPPCRFSPRWPGLWGQLRTDADWVHLSESLARGAAAGVEPAREDVEHLVTLGPPNRDRLLRPLPRWRGSRQIRSFRWPRRWPSLDLPAVPTGRARPNGVRRKSSAIMDPHRGNACALTRTSTRPSRRSRRELLSPRLFITPMRATLARLRGAHRNVAELGAITGVDTSTFGPTCATAPPGRGGR